MTAWRPVVGYEGVYEVSDEGAVRSLVRRTVNNKPVRARILEPQVDAAGYVYHQLNRDRVPRFLFVHQMVAAAFIGPCPEGHEVNHKNGVKGNNRLDNLEYATSSENALHRSRVLGLSRGSGNGKHVLVETDISKIRQLAADGLSQRKIALRFGVRHAAIGSVLSGRTWSHVA